MRRLPSASSTKKLTHLGEPSIEARRANHIIIAVITSIMFLLAIQYSSLAMQDDARSKDAASSALNESEAAKFKKLF